MNPAESQRRGEDCHVSRLEAIHRFLVGVESNELAFLGDVHAVATLALERVVAAVQPVFEHIRHGDQFHGAAGAV